MNIFKPIFLYLYIVDMTNIFVQLKSQIKVQNQALTDLIATQDNESTSNAFEEFVQAANYSYVAYADITVKLISLSKSAQLIQKLLSLLVYFTCQLSSEQGIQVIGKVKNLNLTIVKRVKFFSMLFKSSRDNQLKKNLLFSSLELIENDPKLSSYSSFVENFDLVINSVKRTSKETISLYSTLIKYLSKHIIYKNLWPKYLSKSLLKVDAETANLPEVTEMIANIIKTNCVNEDTIKLLSHQPLKINPLFKIFQGFVIGDFDQISQQKPQQVERANLNFKTLLRTTKVHAIPRLFRSIKTASYDQIAQLLKIDKKEVEGYIIQAIHEGTLKAKLDEFLQTIVVNQVNLKYLTAEQKNVVQKDIIELVKRLESI